MTRTDFSPGLVLCALGLLAACAPAGTVTVDRDYGEAEWERSAVPIRPGIPGERPFWNAYSARFIYAPAFDFPRIENAAEYRFQILSLRDSSIHRFESDVPWAAMSPVWTSVPVGTFDIRVVGVSSAGDSLGVAGEGRYYRAAPFSGPYHQPVIPYDSSARLALNVNLHKDFVEYWLTHRKPDPSYGLYRYSAKIFGSLIVGAVTHARLSEGTADAERSTEIARIVADYLLGISFPPGTPLEHFPPTYHGDQIGKNPRSHIQLDNYLTIAAAEAGHAYLDLYDHTGEERYLAAATRIARTYLNTQLENGSWYLYVNHRTGEPTAEQIAIPTAMIAYFSRLKDEYGMDGLGAAIDRAFAWIMENPVQTFDWLAQFEDVNSARFAPYERLSREQACDLAIYLFEHYPDDPRQEALAEDLIRFAEDQFVIWEQADDLAVIRGRTLRPPADSATAEPGWYSKSWLTPTVHEQYGFWMPTARGAGIMIDTYWAAFEATGKDVYLAKAVSFANNLTRVQQRHDGDYPTMFTPYPMQFWINNALYPARVMARLHANLERIR